MLNRSLNKMIFAGLRFTRVCFLTKTNQLAAGRGMGGMSMETSRNIDSGGPHQVTYERKLQSKIRLQFFLNKLLKGGKGERKSTTGKRKKIKDRSRRYGIPRKVDPNVHGNDQWISFLVCLP